MNGHGQSCYGLICGVNRYTPSSSHMGENQWLVIHERIAEHEAIDATHPGMWNEMDATCTRYMYCTIKMRALEN